MSGYYFAAHDPPQKPWRAEQFGGLSYYHWFVVGKCPFSRDARCGDANYECSPQCAHQCSVCGVRGEHVVAFELEEHEARHIVRLQTIDDVYTFLLKKKKRFVLFPSYEEAQRFGVPQRVYPRTHVPHDEFETYKKGEIK